METSMRVFIATVDLVIHADSHAEAQNRLHGFLTDHGIHADHDPVLVDWSYIPAQRQPRGAWPKEVAITPDWLAVPEGERDASLLFHERENVESMTDKLAALRKRIEFAMADATHQNRQHPTSRSAGYLEGYSDGLKDAWLTITGAEFA
jgi:hypothetical protein